MIIWNMVFFIPPAVTAGIIALGGTTAAAVGGRTIATVATRASIGKLGKKYFTQTFLPTFGQSLPFGVGYGSGTFLGFPGNYRNKSLNRSVPQVTLSKMPYNRFGRFYRRRRFFRRYRRRYY